MKINALLCCAPVARHPHALHPLLFTALLLTACPDTQAPADTDAPTTSGTTAAGVPTSFGDDPTAATADCIPIALDDAPVTVVGLGIHPLGAEVCFELPAGVLGYTLIGSSHPGHFWFTSLVGPQGEAEINDGYLTGTKRAYRSEKFFLSNEEFVSPVLAAVPQRSTDQAMPPRPGPWRLELGEGDTSTPASEVELELWLRRVPGDVPDRLHVNVFAAAATITEERAKETVSLAFEDFAGLELGEVQVFVLPDAATVIDDDLELARLWVATSGVDPRPALNVILTTELNAGFFPVIGTAASIPGPARRHGTRDSGVALQVSGDPAVDAIFLAHESGHYAGLLHTSELAFITAHDALDDTPECNSSDAIEACPDSDNLMFSALAGLKEPQATLTRQQQIVVQASALYEGDAPGLAAVNGATRPQRRSKGWHEGLELLSSGIRTALVACHRTQAPLRSSLAESQALLRLAADPTSSLVLRRRALELAGLEADAAGVALLWQTAKDREAARALRLGALRGLSAAGERGRVAALSGDPDLAIGQSVRALLGR